MSKSVSENMIEKQICFIRGHRVMLSTHLAELYGVQAKVLLQAVKRNLERFPSDFMFQLTWHEAKALRSQRVTLKEGASRRGQHLKYLPYAFTQEGVAMLSSVLRSPQAVQVNIAIMRAFVRLKEILSTHKELALKLSQLEGRIEKHDDEIQAIFEVIRELMTPPPKTSRRRIGFHAG